MEISVIASWPQVIWKALETEGVDPRPVFESVGLNPTLLGQPDARYDAVKVLSCWDEAARISQAKCFGIEASKFWHPLTLSALSLAWFSSSSLVDAFERLARCIKVVNTGVTADFKKVGANYIFSFTPKDRSIRVSGEGPHAALASLVAMCRQSLNQAFIPVSVQMFEAKGSCHSELRKYFACPIEYEAPHYGLTMRAADLDKHLLSDNLTILASADRQISEMLAKLDKDDIISRARKVIFDLLPSGDISEDRVANELHMSSRTLNRRLKEHGHSFRSTLDVARRELADAYLSNPNYSITEISYLLGFSDSSSFSRKYKNWTGKSPISVRHSIS